jgi:hypothetical protein
MMRSWIVALALCGVVAGQSTARIEGRVVSQNGEPVRKATVQLEGGQPLPGQEPMAYVEISDSAGKFAIEGLAAGRYTISASRAGFAASSNSAITVQAGQVKTDVEIKLAPLGVISGQITDQDGDPVVGVYVSAMGVQYNRARRRLAGWGQTQSDDQGNYRLLNIAPGRYYPVADNMIVRNNLAAAQRRGRSAQDIDVPTFYPGAADFGGAVAIDVGAGAEVRGVNIRLAKGRVVRIRGKAVNSRTGGPASGQLLLRPKGNIDGLPDSYYNAALDQTGAFEFHGVRAGTYSVQAMPETQNPLAGRLEVTVTNSDLDGLVLPLGPPPEVSGTIRAEGGDLRTVLQPPAVVAGGLGGGIAGTRILFESPENEYGMMANVAVEADGTFKVPNLPWAQYTVLLNPLQPGTYVKSMRFGGQDAIKSPIDLTSGAGGVLEILLSPKAAEVDVTVRGKDGVAVTIWPKTAVAFDPLSGREFRTGQNGSVKLTSVPPGEYYVAAWEEVDPNILGYPDFLARFTDLASAVSVGESDKVSVDLTPIPKDKIAAEVAKLP